MATRFNMEKSLDVLEFTSTNEWGHPKHKHNFFELTFILNGSGQHVLNDLKIPYKKGDLFFLTPKDEHEFLITESTQFGVIKFTEQLFIEKTEFFSNTSWKNRVESVIFHTNTITGNIINNDIDRKQLFALYELIKTEIKNTFIYSRNVLLELFGALLIIVSRNLIQSVASSDNFVDSKKEKIETILTYVRQNILDKEKIRIKSIANEFNMSPNYVSVFIKKHTGISIQNYVMNVKIQMSERLLKQTSLNVSEVAKKIGFVDASHFNKTFKKYVGKNPSEYN
ncbi:AraC family transcriptional regulator [Tenacibaculum sp. nBUS_03]|uniref:AraC family transcriptional regulator n=1 Tax=Tenacibaculum sp. nBUS_03 TaxID=3395320 RepID=UPI003EB81DCF